MLVFISTMSQISRLYIAGDIQQMRNVYLVFYVYVYVCVCVLSDFKRFLIKCDFQT